MTIEDDILNIAMLCVTEVREESDPVECESIIKRHSDAAHGLYRKYKIFGTDDYIALRELYNETLHFMCFDIPLREEIK